MIEFEEVVKFHGHVCPGLAMGYRVAALAVDELGLDHEKDDILAIAENKSCAVDAIQVLTGCTFGKGNLQISDYGKQVYTIVRRPQGEGIRIAVHWIAPSESPETQEIWQKFRSGDRSTEVVQAINKAKAHKAKVILGAKAQELFNTKRVTIDLPERAQVYPTVTCQACGEKMMEPKAVKGADGSLLCNPCWVSAAGN